LVGGPDEGFGIGVCLSDEAVDGDLQVNDGSEHAALEATAREFGEEAFDRVEPGCGGRGEVERPPGMPGQLGPPPGEATHWTGRMLAKAAGVSLRSVQRILEAHQLAPHRIRTFKLSNDPKFAEKLKDVVGLYVDPPAHAVVLSVDEKSQIQALDRTQPGLPMKPGRAGTMSHDYKRHGTTTLFAALNVLDGTVIGRNMQRHLATRSSSASSTRSRSRCRWEK
jgi:hypothetical protein